MPNNVPQMRAPTTREKMYDYMQQFLGSIAEQPAARIAEPVLGIKGMQESQVMPFTPRSAEEMAMGAVMGSIGGSTAPKNRLFPTSKYAFREGLTSNQQRANTAENYARNEYRRGGPSGRKFGEGNTPAETRNQQYDYKRSEQLRQERGQPTRDRIEAEKSSPAQPDWEDAQFWEEFRNRKNPGPLKPGIADRGVSPTEVRPMHPSLPPEFNMTRPTRTGPIDMNEMPSGTMEYLDPDVAEYMNPARPDPTTIEGQRRLRFLMGQR